MAGRPGYFEAERHSTGLHDSNISLDIRDHKEASFAIHIHLKGDGSAIANEYSHLSVHCGFLRCLTCIELFVPKLPRQPRLALHLRSE